MVVFKIADGKETGDSYVIDVKLLPSLLDELPMAISLQRPDYSIFFANRTFCEHFGDTAGKHCYELIHGLHAPCPSCPAFSATASHTSQLWERHHPNGSIYEVYACPFTDINGSPLVLEVAIGITALKKAEWGLRVYARDLEAKNRELEVLRNQMAVVTRDLDDTVRERTAEVEKLLRQKDDFITQLGHDLKTPLTPLVALLPRIMKEESDPKLKELLGITVDRVYHMKELITKTLKLARINSLYIKLDLMDMDVREEVETILGNSEFAFKKKNITVDNKIPADLIFRGDRMFVNEIFDNILSNAIKHIPESGGCITIDAGLEWGTLAVTVQDTGSGMTDEQLGQIFDEFYKGNSSRHDLTSFGLGLTIVKRIVERHGGKIWASSPGLGKGSTIHFTLKTPIEVG